MIMTGALLYIALLFTGPGPQVENDSFTVYIAQQGWHTAIILRVPDVPPEIWPEIRNYSPYQWVDVSWGDREYFTAPKGTILLALKAALLPGESVLLVLRFNEQPEDVYGEKATLAGIRMDKESFYNLCRFISSAFQRNNGELMPANPNGFFLAERKYHLFRTCNTWVALALREAGFKVNTFPIITASQMFRQAERIDGLRYIDQ